jgi:uridylate kinase
MAKTHVIKLGGSMVSKSLETMFDFQYFKKFADVIRKFIVEGDKFFIVLGGGFMMRKLRDISKEGGVIVDHDLHWIGTTYNNVNAEIARSVLSNISNERIYAYEQYYSNDPIYFEKSVIFGGGGRAGHSSDMDTHLIAKKLGITEVISLKNIDGVYTADPKVDSNAKKLDKATWEQYFEIIGFKDKHEPGGNYPIDPVTAKLVKEAGQKFLVMDGNDLESFEKALKGESFNGTVVGN